MKAIYLKFPSEVDLSEYLGRDTEGYSVDVIGTIYTSAVMDGDEVVSPAVALDGWHVNMLVPDDFDVFAEYEVIPILPRRIFGGW